MTQSDTERLVYTIDLRIPGVEQLTRQTSALRTELDTLRGTGGQAGQGLSQAGTAAQASRQQLGDLSGVAQQAGLSMQQVAVSGDRLTATLRQTGSTTEAARTLREIGASSQDAASHLAPLIAQLEQVTAANARATISLRQVGDETRSLSVSVREATAVATPWTQAVNQLSGTIPGLSQAISVYSGAMQANAAATAQAAAASGGAGAAMGGLAVAAVPAAAAVAAITAAAVHAVATFGDYQQALLKTAALTESGAQFLGQYDEGIQRLAQTMPVTAKSLAEGLYVVASDGFKGAQALDILEVSAKAASAGLGQTNDIARVVTSAMNAYGRENLSAARATDILTAAATEGHVPAEHFVTALSRVLPIAAPLGVSFEQLAANIATMTRMGSSAEQAATGLATALSAMAAPGQQAKEALAEIGISAEDLRRMMAEDLVGTMQLLIERTGGNYEILHKLIPEIRAMRDVMATAGAQGENYAQVLDAIEHSTGRTDKAFQTALTGWNAQMTILHNRFTAWEIDMGSKIVPKLLEFGDDVHNITTGVGMLSSAVGTWARGVVDHLAGIKEAYDRLPGPFRAGVEGAALGLPGRLGGGSAGDEGGAVAGAGWADSRPPQGPRLAERMIPPSAGYAGLPAYEDIRASQAAMAALSSEGQHLVSTMGDIAKVQAQGAVSSEVMRQKLEALAQAEAKQEEAWAKAFDPAEAQQRIGRLKALTDQYSAALQGHRNEEAETARQAIAVYLQQTAAADVAATQAKRLQTEQHAAAAEAQRILNEQKRLQREALQADVGTGLSEAMAKGLQSADMRADLTPAAQRVMESFFAAMAAQGTSSAASAGKNLGDAILAVTNEMKKAGVSDWQETMAGMFDVADAIRRNAPGAVDAFHDLALHVSQEIEDARIQKVYAAAWEKAQEEVEQGFTKHEDALATATQSAASGLEAIVQTETDRQYDIWAAEHVRELGELDKTTMEKQRLGESRAREDTDRQERVAREGVDRASQAQRQINDLSIRQQEGEADLLRRRQRESSDAAYQHQQRLTEIRRQGGPDVAKRLADEELQYQQSIADRQRSMALDDTERKIKNAQQASDAQRRITEQMTDAQRKTGEQESDLAKTRTRQDADRTQQEGDRKKLHQLDLDHQAAFHTDAQSKALRRFNDDLARIDARWAHEEEKAGESYAKIQAKAEHDRLVSGIKAEGGPDMDDRLRAENERYNVEVSGINTTSREAGAATDAALRSRLAANAQASYAAAFVPNGPSAVTAGALQPPSLVPAGPTRGAVPAPAPTAGTAPTPGATTVPQPITVTISIADSVVTNDAAISQLAQRIGQEFLTVTRGRLMAGRSPS